jgi:hypothetical protein
MNDDQLKKVIKGMDDTKLDHLIYLAVEEHIIRNIRTGCQAKYITCINCEKRHWVIDTADNICPKCKGFDRRIKCTDCSKYCCPTDPEQTTCGPCKKLATKKAKLAVSAVSAVSVPDATTASAASTVSVPDATTAGTASVPDGVPRCGCGSKLSPTKRPDIVKLCYDCMKIDYFTRFPVL